MDIFFVETGETKDTSSEVLFYEKLNERSNTAIVNPLKSTPTTLSFTYGSTASSATDSSTSKTVVNFIIISMQFITWMYYFDSLLSNLRTS